MTVSTTDTGVQSPDIRPRPARRARRAGAIELPVLLALSAAALVWGWQNRASGDLTAETGAGYLLGIVGGAMMLILLIYPLRKRLPGLRVLGGVPGWFRFHMILGIAGPILVILHSNFKLGSLNSSIALATMLVVASSGLVGRFLYGRIHHGLYGRRAQLREFMDDVDGSKWGVGEGTSVADGLMPVLEAYQKKRLDGSDHLLPALLRVLNSPLAQMRLQRTALHTAWPGTKPSRADKRRFRAQLHLFQLAIARIEAFRLYERLFALWHLLHLPLFVIMVLAALGHVLAVHMY